MENDKMFDLMTKMYADLKQGQENMRKELSSKIDSIDKKVDKTNITIENDIKPKIEVLFDGYKQNSDKLDRIEKQVSKHDEFIIRRIK
ncbi:hypothetical protein [Clostridium tyrobutyricum]|uniref:hypothetical protein n=1 Tax=Clostridium tyrobutyricum TaxID=1519 RepID=UPI000301BD00|nr:hypothetical protein [Clostridium tyrobutyricum]MBV4415107.1 hypothetical protein [Clostridium tyrobutyricum]MEA5007589.1 hypothetical protein [Clostridium tyrobutyricum]